MSVRDLIIVGAGPSGLAAAIAAKRNGLDYQVLERGALVNSIFRFPPQMIFFTTPELLEIGGLPFISPYEKPTRAEALKYYRKVADTYDLQIAFDETVLSIDREEDTGEPIFSVTTRSSRAVRRIRHAWSVILAIGYYDRPVLLGVPGEDLPHVRHFYGEPHPYYRQRVVVVGGGNSAAEASLELHRAGAFVTLVHRWPGLKPTIKYWVKPDIENRIKEGSIAARFNTCVREIRPTSVVLNGPPPFVRGQASTSEAGGQPNASGQGLGSASVEKEVGKEVEKEVQEEMEEEEVPADAVFLLTGYRADTDLMQRAGITLSDRGAPTYDPETFETNVAELFVAGGALAGVDTGMTFIENGRFHGEKIIEVIVRRRAQRL